MDLREQDAAHPYRHPWELSRTHELLNLLQRNPATFRYADIGAGDQYVTRHLLSITSKPVHAVEILDTSGPADPRIVLHRSVREIPKESVDCLLLLDVLEHVAEDASLLAESLQALKTGGTILVTVPAFPTLFSDHDVFLKHHRRYTRRQLLDVLKHQGVVVREHYYFYTLLCGVRWIEKALKAAGLVKKKPEGIGRWPYPTEHGITRVFEAVLNADFAVNRWLSQIGVRLPGLSLCALGTKRDGPKTAGGRSG